MREPQLGIAVGKRGIGKTHTTLQILNEYILGFGVNAKPRKLYSTILVIIIYIYYSASGNVILILFY